MFTVSLETSTVQDVRGEHQEVVPPASLLRPSLLLEEDVTPTDPNPVDVLLHILVADLQFELLKNPHLGLEVVEELSRHGRVILQQLQDVDNTSQIQLMQIEQEQQEMVQLEGVNGERVVLAFPDHSDLLYRAQEEGVDL